MTRQRALNPTPNKCMNAVPLFLLLFWRGLFRSLLVIVKMTDDTDDITEQKIKTADIFGGKKQKEDGRKALCFVVLLLVLLLILSRRHSLVERSDLCSLLQ